MSPTLLDSFRSYIDRHELVTHDDRILLTVSGGVDSMVMLALFAAAGYRVGVAHCNFQLRGAESDEDELLVEREAAKYGVPFYNRRFETAAEMERTGESMEMAARRLRYAWFDALSREGGLHGGGRRPPCRRLDRDLLHQPAARHRTARPDGDFAAGGAHRPPAVVRLAQGDPRIRRGAPHPVPRGFVKPLDKVPAQQDPAGPHPPHPRDQPQIHGADAPQPRAAHRRAALHRPQHRPHPRGRRSRATGRSTRSASTASTPPFRRSSSSTNSSTRPTASRAT